jgi:hypothetical protein
MNQEASSPTRRWRVRRSFFAGSLAKHLRIFEPPLRARSELPILYRCGVVP